MHLSRADLMASVQSSGNVDIKGNLPLFQIGHSSSKIFPFTSMFRGANLGAKVTSTLAQLKEAKSSHAFPIQVPIFYPFYYYLFGSYFVSPTAEMKLEREKDSTPL